MKRTRILTLASLLVVAVATCGAGQDLAEPVRLEFAGRPIDVEVGHAAPFIYDMDGDGRRDLLVGQFGQGKLRVYRNVGTNEKPVYEGFTYFQAGGGDATVPAG